MSCYNIWKHAGELVSLHTPFPGKSTYSGGGGCGAGTGGESLAADPVCSFGAGLQGSGVFASFFWNFQAAVVGAAA